MTDTKFPENFSLSLARRDMPRLSRVVAVHTPHHHVTQRGNAGRFVFETDSDRLAYLQLLQKYSRVYRLSILGYCLMSNHVHIIAVPERVDSLERTLQLTHSRYAVYFNTRRDSTGHLWQGRFYSCPMDLAHLWRALRYTELNPVRAGLVADPAAYLWSSAAVHCGRGDADALLDLAPWRDGWCASDWADYLAAAVSEDEVKQIRQGTHTGRPLGSEEFTRHLERTLGRLLVPTKGGRSKKILTDPQQQALALG